MAFGGKVHHRARPFAGHQRGQHPAIENVAVLKSVACMIFDRTQIVEIAGVGQLVKIQNARGFGRDPLQNEVRADEPGSAGDENEIFHAGKASLWGFRSPAAALSILMKSRGKVRTRR